MYFYLSSAYFRHSASPSICPMNCKDRTRATIIQSPRIRSRRVPASISRIPSFRNVEYINSWKRVTGFRHASFRRMRLIHASSLPLAKYKSAIFPTGEYSRQRIRGNDICARPWRIRKKNIAIPQKPMDYDGGERGERCYESRCNDQGTANRKIAIAFSVWIIFLRVTCAYARAWGKRMKHPLFLNYTQHIHIYTWNAPTIQSHVRL